MLNYIVFFSNINKTQCIYQLKKICRGFLRCMALSYALGLYDGWEATHAVRRTCLTMREANIWIKLYYNIIKITIAYLKLKRKKLSKKGGVKGRKIETDMNIFHLPRYLPFLVNRPSSASENLSFHLITIFIQLKGLS